MSEPLTEKTEDVRMILKFLNSLEIGAPELATGVALLPLRLKTNPDLKTLAQATEDGSAEVLESESVNILRIATSSPTPVLIPYLQVVTGGKQDRMITVPIILSPSKGEKEIRDVPVNCVEQGRWTFARGGQQTSSKFDIHQKVRMSPSMGFVNVMAEQSTTWGSIAKYRSKRADFVPEEAASSQSFAEMEEIAQETEEEKISVDKETKEILFKAGKAFPDQNGLALFIGNELIGVELYGTPQLWESQQEGVVNSFITELSIHGEIEGVTIEENLEEIFRTSLLQIQLEKKEPIDAGQIFVSKPGKDRDYSALLIEHEDQLAEFYYAKGQAEFFPSEGEGFPGMEAQEDITQRIVSLEEEELPSIEQQAFPDEEEE